MKKIKHSITNYSVGDFLIKVKNAAMAKNKKIEVYGNRKIVAIAEALKKLGYLDEVKKDKQALSISLAFKNKKPLLIDLRLVSKPGLRIYLGVDEIASKKGPSTFIISTPKGILSSRESIKTRTGGEVIAEIW
ncbi:MAG: ribosomal protein S8, small subunit ribosomal protein S8 [Microgenomates group bacterium GW2011_GWC1_39_7b]|uniref:Small ribosomal subunit protein uS8 n=3 Tax=Candidatus Woeseibacteriota TaxID=1752722 RepID=A0A0G0LJE8_9BACT|nr:MAG: 30S ribosomal protein S8 [Candidatus Woesebacteria bacterium GW2011_GWB1_39_10]KKR26318.1 MAG: ribosomal protein S8, small subunit ribosomal protein S8 [Microgenomates group bacterium GW2011_GWC1_39_7b]KKR71691.1 MAG: 30S ribosomal protein S8 [Candidatus Woesebacteria bacterium GW2011_GWA2_40_7]KKS91008.1 MAG: 30S ribosomal protein S8 [Candidatus Woesebacteria bacterium GW2011_GWA1_43_12]